MYLTLKRDNRYEYVIPIENTPLEFNTITEIKEIMRGFIDNVDTYEWNIIPILTDGIKTQIKVEKEALIKDLQQIKVFWRGENK